MTPSHAFEKAIEIMGGQTSAAKKIKITQGALSKRISAQKGARPEDCLRIEKATEYKITRYQLRPDIFGKSAKA